MNLLDLILISTLVCMASAYNSNPRPYKPRPIPIASAHNSNPSPYEPRPRPGPSPYRPRPDGPIGSSHPSRTYFNSGVVCPSLMQPCNDGTCIPDKWFCDQEQDCASGEDEGPQFCRSNNFSPIINAPSPFQALSKPFQQPLTPFHQPSTPFQQPPAPFQQPSKICEDDFFYCDGYCIPLSYKCDGKKNCADGNDEMECTPSVSSNAFPMISFRQPCADDEEQCFDGKCISIYQLCNDVNDCSGGEDEFACSTTVPKAAAFRCMEKCFGVIRLPCKSSIKSFNLEAVITTTTTTTPAPLPTKRECPTNMDLVLDRCVYVHVVPPLTWNESNDWSNAHDVSLVEVDSGNFFVALLKHLNNTNMDSYSFWVGANDLNNEGEWRWVTSNTPVYLGTPLWAIASNGVSYVQQPGGGRHENCALLENCPFNYLNDFDCQETRGFIAQHPGQLVFA